MDKADNLIKEVKAEVRGMRKANVDLFPSQLILKCGWLEVHSDGNPSHTQVTIDGKPAKGIYSIHVNLNTQRATKVELGVFMDEFNFNTETKKGER